MAEKENRFMNFENSMSIYRSKTAMIIGVLYFSKGYQSTPVIGLQFATVNDPDAKEKTFNWDAEEKCWYFPTYDKCYELYRKVSKWRIQMTKLRESATKDNKEIQDKYKDIADKQKIANPIKKKTLFMRPSYYEGTYFLQMTLNLGKDNYITVALAEDEVDMLLQYIGDFIKNYHNLALIHRQIMLARGQAKEAGGNGGGNGGSKQSYSGGSKGGGYRKPSDSPPNDSFGSGGGDSGGASSGKSSTSEVDSLLQGSSLDDLMKDMGNMDGDIPF